MPREYSLWVNSIYNKHLCWNPCFSAGGRLSLDSGVRRSFPFQSPHNFPEFCLASDIWGLRTYPFDLQAVHPKTSSTLNETLNFNPRPKVDSAEIVRAVEGGKIVGSVRERDRPWKAGRGHHFSLGAGVTGGLSATWKGTGN